MITGGFYRREEADRTRGQLLRAHAISFHPPAPTMLLAVSCGLSLMVIVHLDLSSFFLVFFYLPFSLCLPLCFCTFSPRLSSSSLLHLSSSPLSFLFLPLLLPLSSSSSLPPLSSSPLHFLFIFLLSSSSLSLPPISSTSSPPPTPPINSSERNRSPQRSFLSTRPSSLLPFLAAPYYVSIVRIPKRCCSIGHVLGECKARVSWEFAECVYLCHVQVPLCNNSKDRACAFSSRLYSHEEVIFLVL